MADTWRVTRQRETVAQDPDTHEYGRMIEVSFVTDAGDTGIIYVRPTQFTEQAVRGAIEARVAVMNALRAGPASV